jgi:hypothetical protein
MLKYVTAIYEHWDRSREIRIMNKMIKTICAISLLFSMQASFACDYPARLSLANGITASKEEMVQSQRDVKTFVADMEIYLECILEEEKTTRSEMGELLPEDEQQREEMLNKKYNAAVEEMEKVAAQFNAEVQTYKGRDDT